MANGRRYYGTLQFLRLQKILYFKEIGFSLKKIKSILGLKNRSEVSLLTAQKEVLVKEIQRLEKVAKSIDRAIEHYKGNTMSEQEICNQFDNIHNKVKEYQKLAEEQFGKEFIDESMKKLNAMSQEERVAHGKKGIEVMNKVVVAINNNVEPDSEEAQALMQECFDINSVCAPLNKEMYLNSRECLLEDLGPFPARKLHPKLPEFMYEAMGIFATSTFSE